MQDLKDFLDKSPTAWHAVDQMSERFISIGFSQLDMKKAWTLKKGHKYFVPYGGALCAFILPFDIPKKGRIMAAHTDSPSLKLKPKSHFSRDDCHLISIETYGSPIINSWFNKDLGLAGKVFYKDNESVKEKLITLDKSPLIIPQLSIHLNQKGDLDTCKKEHLIPVLGLDHQTAHLNDFITDQTGIHSIIDSDLFLFPTEKASFLGYQKELIASHKIDNLFSCLAICSALADQKETSADQLNISVFWDHEEIGSRSLFGAEGPFLNEVLIRIFGTYGIDDEQASSFKANSICLSIDMAQGVHPNYLETHDLLNRPLLGKGITLKYNANKRYATESSVAALLIKTFQDLNLSHQTFSTRHDMRCGSTVGPIIETSFGIPTVDIGCPQWSMHSTREVASCADYLDLISFLTHFFNQDITS